MQRRSFLAGLLGTTVVVALPLPKLPVAAEPMPVVTTGFIRVEGSMYLGQTMPSLAAVGDVYYNTARKTIQFFSGEGWCDLELPQANDDFAGTEVFIEDHGDTSFTVKARTYGGGGGGGKWHD